MIVSASASAFGLWPIISLARCSASAYWEKCCFGHSLVLLLLGLWINHSFELLKEWVFTLNKWDNTLQMFTDKNLCISDSQLKVNSNCNEMCVKYANITPCRYLQCTHWKRFSSNICTEATVIFIFLSRKNKLQIIFAVS